MLRARESDCRSFRTRPTTRPCRSAERIRLPSSASIDNCGAGVSVLRTANRVVKDGTPVSAKRVTKLKAINAKLVETGAAAGSSSVESRIYILCIDLPALSGDVFAEGVSCMSQLWSDVLTLA